MKKLYCLLKSSFLPATILILFCLPYSVKAVPFPFTATYKGLNEVPSNASTATGTITGTYDSATNTISFTITFSGLGSNTSAAHFHGPAFPGTNAPVTYAHTGFPTGVTSGTLTGTQVITDAEEKDLLAGKWYSNIHTVNFPGGEIRALIFFSAPYVAAPTIKCPKDTTVSNATNQCSQSVAFKADTTGSTPAELSYRIGTTVITSPFNFSVGTTTVTATALNGGGFASCTFNVIVKDTQPPVITCPANISAFNDPGLCGAKVNFTPTATDNCPKVTVTSVPASGSFFPVGVTTVTSTATDSSGNTASCSFKVTVIDNEPPVISNLKATPNSLWPPNHKWKNVAVDYTSTDNCKVISCSISVTSNESENGHGDGNTSSDWHVIDDHHIQLRAERSGQGDGRIYTIKVTCVDSSGNEGTATTNVKVLHNRFADLTHGNSGHVTVHITPNPSSDQFTLHIQTTDNVEKINVKIVDLAGRVVESKMNLTGDQVLRVGEHLTPGVYFVQLQQGTEIKQIKLLKLK